MHEGEETEGREAGGWRERERNGGQRERRSNETKLTTRPTLVNVGTPLGEVDPFVEGLVIEVKEGREGKGREVFIEREGRMWLEDKREGLRERRESFPSFRGKHMPVPFGGICFDRT